MAEIRLTVLRLPSHFSSDSTLSSTQQHNVQTSNSFTSNMAHWYDHGSTVMSIGSMLRQQPWQHV
eukprot:4794497-Ditylum_brightwellii.AAC.1